DADRYLADLDRAQTRAQETATENAAIGEYNRAVKAANSARFGEAAAAFRRAAAGSTRDSFRQESLRLARRMELRARGARAMALARAGDVKGALAIFEAMDRAQMTEEDRRWLDVNLAQLRRARR